MTKSRSIPRKRPSAKTTRKLVSRGLAAELQKLLLRRTRELAKTRKLLKDTLQQQNAASEVLQVINSSPAELAPVFDAMLKRAMRLCEAAFGGLWIFKGERYVAEALCGVPPAYASYLRHTNLVPGPHTAPDRFLKGERSAIQNIDLAAEEAYVTGDPQRRALVDLGGARAALQVPLVRDEVVLGVITVYRQEAKPFSEQHATLLQNFAAQAVIAIENTRLFNETQEALERQTATSEILKVIASSPSDVQPVFEVIVERAVRLCGARMGRVYRYDDNVIQMVAGYGLSVPGLGKVQQVFPRPATDDTIAGQVMQSRQAYFVTDIEQDQSVPALSRQMIEALGTRSQVTVPMLLAGGEPIGAITVGWADPGAYQDQQVTMLKTFADQAVIAIENARLFNETKEALERQTATADILKVIASSPSDVRPVFEEIVGSAARLFEPCAATIITARDEKLHWQATAALHPDFDVERARAVYPLPFDSDRFPSARAIAERRIVEIPDSEAPDALDMPRRTGRISGFRSATFVPLINESGGIGVIILTHPLPGFRLSEKQLALVQTFADQAVIAIGNVQLFDEVQQRTRELSKSLDDLRTAQDRLVQTEKLASLGQLTAGIAHEIKNPLNFVNNFSSLSAELVDELDETLVPAPLDQKMRGDVGELTLMLKSNLEKVVQHGKRADSIVKNMLLHSREGSGDHRSADINAIVEDSLNLAYHGARAERSGFTITLQHDLDPHAGAAELYPQEITRALLNLISNGFYAATKRKADSGDDSFEPVLSASTKDLGTAVEIRIRDNGAGIPPDVKEKMFVPFFTTKPTGEGTGLGLSMTHDIIVKQHGGRIDVETEPGVFTEFIITLPRGEVSGSKPE
jgi:two-component system NtrC family sensor kinase